MRGAARPRAPGGTGPRPLPSLRLDLLEAGETPERGLAREIREELGARIRSARFLAFFTETYGPGGFPILATVFQVSLAPGRLRHGSDVAELRWFSRRRLPYREIGFPSAKRALKRFA